MKIQDVFDVAYAVSLTGLENKQQLVRTFFMRSGVRLSYTDIFKLHQEILRVVNTAGYSDPLDFLRDFFPDEDFRRIRVFKKNVGRRIKLPQVPTQPQPELVDMTEEPEPTTIEEPKRTTRLQSPRTDTVEKEVVVLKPIKIKNEITSAEPTEEMTPREKSRVIKYKKTSRRFKEMDQKEKEVDNRFDHLQYRSRIEEGSKRFLDNRSALEESPFMRRFFSDIDLEFRQVMYKIYKYNRTQMKDKTRYASEIEFLEEYFRKKLGVEKLEEDGAKKLSNVIAYLMKKLQTKIFESEDSEVIETMLYFKTKLCTFYNYYRK